MKKLFSLFIIFTVSISSIFADISRFYKNGKVLDTMYINSEEGLRVRDYPSLKSNRLCSLSYRFPVKVIAIGKEETIDNITAPWVEILIPAYEWKSNEPEYGWVFGGYLIDSLPEFKIPETKEEFTKYMEESFWNLAWECGGDGAVYFGFFQNGKLYLIKDFDDFLDSGKAELMINFRAVSGNEYYSDEYYYMGRQSIYDTEKVRLYYFKNGTFEITYITENNFSNNGGSACEGELIIYDFYPSKAFFNLHDDNDDINQYFSNNNIFCNKRMFTIIENQNVLQYLFEEKLLNKEIAIKCIQKGFSAAGTSFQKDYQEYWDPIMKNHQKKIDAMK